MSRWKFVREHIWCDEHSEPILRHAKCVREDGTVKFPWQTRVLCGDGVARWLMGVRIPHPPLLYPLPEFVAADRRDHIWLAEGERDTDSLRAHGVLAVTHGGALGFSSEHADLFIGWRGRITIVRDRDDAGAVDAVRRYDGLRSVGIPAQRLRIVRGRVRRHKADVTDHLDAGYALDQFISEPVAKVRRIAAEATPQSIAESGSAGGINPRTGYVFSMSATELDSLRNWKPVTS